MTAKVIRLREKEAVFMNAPPVTTAALELAVELEPTDDTEEAAVVVAMVDAAAVVEAGEVTIAAAGVDQVEVRDKVIE